MFSKTSRNINYDVKTMVLSAETKNSKGEWFRSYINLGDCITTGGGNNLQIIPLNQAPFTYNGVTVGGLLSLAELHFKSTPEYVPPTQVKVTFDEEIKESRLFTTRYTGKWQKKTASLDLDLCIRNNEGLLEFVTPDKEPANWLKTLANLTSKMGPPGGKSFNFGLAAEDAAMKEKAKSRAATQEEWLRRSYLEGNLRIRPGTANRMT